MIVPCDFLRLVFASEDDFEARDETVIPVDSIIYIHHAYNNVWIKYKDFESEMICTHLEKYDTEKIAHDRYYMILKIMGAEGQLDISKYVKSADKEK